MGCLGCGADEASADAVDTTPSSDAVACMHPPLPTASLRPPRAANPPDPRIETLALYEIQFRSANACDPSIGSAAQRAACAERPAPAVSYRATDSSCDRLEALERIRLGTIDDMLVDTADYRDGITLRYIHERVGANAIWVMPPFPNNAEWRLPEPCDNLGSPYAVQDYFHVRGSLARACIEEGRDELLDPPCWGDAVFSRWIDAATQREILVMLDVAFNHFGHRYRAYDTDYTVDLRQLSEVDGSETRWDFERTLDPALIHPVVVDRRERVDDIVVRDAAASLIAARIDERCGPISDDAYARVFNALRLALPDEAERFDCSDLTLEAVAPRFFLGADGARPSRDARDAFIHEWRDVRFLYLREDDPAHRDAHLRNREYLFRVLNYWVSRGVGGFRLDHATDPYSGLSAEDWSYILEKVSFYAELRSQPRPLILSEEFHNQASMIPYSDAMTEGFLFDLAGRDGRIKDGPYVERVLDGAHRFGFETMVMGALENHDELRLVEGTGFDVWTGWGFWSIAAHAWTMPMLLMGQEFGQPYRLDFKRSHLLHGRFEGTDAYREDGDALVDAYRTVIARRNATYGRALRGTGRRFLRSPRGDRPEGGVAMIRWGEEGVPLLVVHNLWASPLIQELVLPADIAGGLGMRACGVYRLVDVDTHASIVPCQTAHQWMRGFVVRMGAGDRMLIGRMESCDDVGEGP